MNEPYAKVTGKGRPLILIHGFCETHEIWEPFADSISNTVQVYSLDLPGFGQSKIPAGRVTIEQIAADLNDWIVKTGMDHPVIIGHSLGGYVGLAMAALQPALFSGLGLFHSTALPDSLEKKANRLKVIEFVKKNGVQPFIDSFIAGLFYDKQNAFIRKACEVGLKTTQETFLAYTEAMRIRPSRINVLRETQVPILILAGEEDRVLPADSLAEQARLNSKILFYSLKNTGHMGMFEARNEAAAIVNDFIFSTKKGGVI